MIRTSLLNTSRDHLFRGGAVPTLFQILRAPQFFLAKFRKKYARIIRVYTVSFLEFILRINTFLGKQNMSISLWSCRLLGDSDTSYSATTVHELIGALLEVRLKSGCTSAMATTAPLLALGTIMAL